jgi:glucose-specific phosphotransferase system IIA component
MRDEGDLIPFYLKEVFMKLHMPIAGPYGDVSGTPDDVFSQGMVGPGFVVSPTEGFVYAPFDGTVTVLFPTGHAVAITDKSGASVLIHIGLETVNMKGDGFTLHTVQGDQVKAGQLLITFDIEKIKKHADSILSPVVFTDVKSLKVLKTKTVNGRDFLKVRLQK